MEEKEKAQAAFEHIERAMNRTDTGILNEWIAAIEDYIAALEAERRWIAVEERLPDQCPDYYDRSRQYLCFGSVPDKYTVLPDHQFIFLGTFVSEGSRLLADGTRRELRGFWMDGWPATVTHWMPLPQPPTK